MNQTAPQAGVPLSQRAMLISLNISTWTAKKLDKKVTNEIHLAHNAAQDSGRYNKALIAKDALETIAQAAGAARTFHYENTLPWCDDGWRILPAANYLEYTLKMQPLREAFTAAVESFLSNFESFKADAQVRLNGLFNDSDYPSADKLAAKFDFDYPVRSLPNAADFRVDIGEDARAAAAADIQARADAAVRDAMIDLWTRITTAISHMQAKLEDARPTAKGEKAAIFRDSLVENIRELVDLLPRLNLTGDAMMDKTRKAMESQLCRLDPDDLREDPKARAKVARAAAEILADMDSYLHPEPMPAENENSAAA